MPSIVFPKRCAAIRVEHYVPPQRGNLDGFQTRLPAEIAEFIELAVPNLPDSKLINSALEELRARYPLLEIT